MLVLAPSRSAYLYKHSYWSRKHHCIWLSSIKQKGIYVIYSLYPSFTPTDMPTVYQYCNSYLIQLLIILRYYELKYPKDLNNWVSVFSSVLPVWKGFTLKDADKGLEKNKQTNKEKTNIHTQKKNKQKPNHTHSPPHLQFRDQRI